MTPEQSAKVKSAAMLIANNAVGLVGFPSVIPDFYVGLIEESLDEIKAVLYEIDARNSHDDSTAVDERKAA